MSNRKDGTSEALAIWNALLPKIKSEMDSRMGMCVKRKRATVIAAPHTDANGNRVMTVQEPYGTAFDVPYNPALENQAIGTSVWLEWSYSASNMVAVAEGNGTFPASGGGGGTGDMLKSVYDPNNYSQDIFTYADNAANAVSVYWCTYGTTTNAQIVAARSADRLVAMKYNNLVYIMAYTNSATHHEFISVRGDNIYTASVDNNTWVNGYSTYQQQIVINGILKGDGLGNVSSATVDVDYQSPLPSQTGHSGKFLTTDGSSMSWGTPAGGGTIDQTTEVLKGDGNGNAVAAIAGTDYQAPLTAGTDYLEPPASPSDGDVLTYNSGTWDAAAPPVTSVNGQTGAAVLDADDVGALPDTTTTLPNPAALTFGNESYDGSAAKTITAADLGIGDVFTIKGSVNQYSDLPPTGNTVGDVYYVVNDETIGGTLYPGQVGYIWITISGTNQWEQLGQTIDVSALQAKITASGILKGDGAGNISAAVAGTDYQTPLTAGADYIAPPASPSSGDVLTYNGSSWGAAAPSGGSLPSQTGHSGEYLTTDGTDASWAALPTEVFWVIYGTTTNAEIYAAIQAGKLCVMDRGVGGVYYLSSGGSPTFQTFVRAYYVSNGMVRIIVATCDNDIWSVDSYYASIPNNDTITTTTTWTGSDPYTQTVTLANYTPGSYTKVDIQPDAATIAQLISDGVKALYVENNAGTLTMYAIGAAPSVALTLQATCEETRDA